MKACTDNYCMKFRCCATEFGTKNTFSRELEITSDLPTSVSEPVRVGTPTS